MDKRAFFLVIEGLDGSGKSLITRLLAEALESVVGEQRVLLSYEPHDPSAAGQYIRDVLAHRIKATPYTLALAYALNRADHGSRVVAPFLDTDDDGRILVCDRYYLSSLVYQGAPPLSLEGVWTLNEPMRRPDLILFMDASAETCYQRLGQRGGQRELFDDKLAQRREQYQRAISFLAERGHHIVAVDANPDVPAVLANVIGALRGHGPSWLDYPALEAAARAVNL